MTRLLELKDTQLELDQLSRQRIRLQLSEGRALHLLHERAAVVFAGI